MTTGQSTHVCLRDPCVYCLVQEGRELPASVLQDDPDLATLLQRWDTCTPAMRRRFIRLLDLAIAGRPLQLPPPIQRRLVETYAYDRDVVIRDADPRPSPYRILSVDAQLGRRPDECLPEPLADLVVDRVTYAWTHDAAPAIAATTICRPDAAEDFELEFVRRDDRVILQKFHVIREHREFLSTVVHLDKDGP